MTTLVMGATTRKDRYAYMAVQSLREHNQQVIAFGVDIGMIGDVSIENEWNPDWKVDTITLYLNPRRQVEYYDDMIALKPKRVIFNPGTENPEFMAKLRAAGIHAEIACTLVLLSIGKYEAPFADA